MFFAAIITPQSSSARNAPVFWLTASYSTMHSITFPQSHENNCFTTEYSLVSMLLRISPVSLALTLHVLCSGQTIITISLNDYYCFFPNLNNVSVVAVAADKTYKTPHDLFVPDDTGLV
jgi:hypothetical protein